MAQPTPGPCAGERRTTCRVPSLGSVPVSRLGVLLAVRVGADARVAVIAVVRAVTTDGTGMSVVLQEVTFFMANTHSVFANAHHDVHVASLESRHINLNSDGLRRSYVSRMALVTNKSAE